MSACATSSLWSIFHGTGKLFQHPIPSPSSITRMAMLEQEGTIRTFPNIGLSPSMICNAIKMVTLEPQKEEIEGELEKLKSLTHAYLSAKIPIIMVVRLISVGGNKSWPKDSVHSVAITGYNLGSTNKLECLDSSFYLKSSGIDKLYVHDDQVGPFARMEFNNKEEIVKTIGLKEKKLSNFFKYFTKSDLAIDIEKSLSTSWRHNGTDIGYIRAIPSYVIIPLYKKIRVSFNDILKRAQALNILFNKGMAKFIDIEPPFYCWEITLATVNDFKSKLRSESAKSNDSDIYLMLSTPLPKYIWLINVYSFTNQKIKVATIIYDATDLSEGSSYQGTVHFSEYGDFFKRSLNMMLSKINVENDKDTWIISDMIRKIRENETQKD